MFGSLRNSVSAMAMLAGLAARSHFPTPLPPVKQHRRGAKREVGIDMRYIGSAWKRVQSGKNYPHSSQRQWARHCANYECGENGTIVPLSRAMRRALNKFNGE